MNNYGKSGDDALECLARINANQTFFGHVPVQDWGITYGVIAMQDNDGPLFAADRETYRENFKKIAEAIRAMGATPILGTEHDWSENYYGLMALAEEEGYLFMDWGKTANAMGRFTPFWQGGHPATRTHWLWTYGMKPYLDALPRLQIIFMLPHELEMQPDVIEHTAGDDGDGQKRDRLPIIIDPTVQVHGGEDHHNDKDRNQLFLLSSGLVITNGLDQQIPEQNNADIKTGEGQRASEEPVA